MTAILEASDAERLERCVASGGIAVFPSDTVYGICCAPDDARAVARLYELKGRPADRAAAVMFFSLERALAALPELDQEERSVLQVLLPGPVTLLLRNRESRFAPACGPDPSTLGLRVPLLCEGAAALRQVTVPVMQSSANLSGQPDARRLADVPGRLLDGADVVLDGGGLPGTPSTVIDLRDYGRTRGWRVLREGAVPEADVRRALDAPA